MQRPVTLHIEKKAPDSLARAGVLRTPHGDIKTPAFMAVATKATAKGIPQEFFPQLGIQGLVANAYHLYLTPGEMVVAHAGGVGKFMSFNGPTMTDSGGFQILSLGGGMGKKILSAEVEKPAEAGVAYFDEDVATSHGKFAVVDDEGVSFTSHHDGSLHRFTPERSIEIQHELGADIMFAFDECTASSRDHEYQSLAMDRTHRWAKRCLSAHRGNVEKNASQALYGIVQGGRFEDLRIESAKTLADMDFDGYGIGGSFNKEDILATLDTVDRILPEKKPRHLLGIGEPEDLLLGAAAGIDTFDCVLPTRNGRNGTVYTHRGKTSIERAEYKEDLRPIDEKCDCFVCVRYTRSYIHHLFRSGEMLGLTLASAHNMRFLTRMCDEIRQAILDDRLPEYSAQFLAEYKN
jgi:queuine tRNA-ribosyltransferase